MVPLPPSVPIGSMLYINTRASGTSAALEEIQHEKPGHQTIPDYGVGGAGHWWQVLQGQSDTLQLVAQRLQQEDYHRGKCSQPVSWVYYEYKLRI